MQVVFRRRLPRCVDARRIARLAHPPQHTTTAAACHRTVRIRRRHVPASRRSSAACRFSQDRPAPRRRSVVHGLESAGRATMADPAARRCHGEIDAFFSQIDEAVCEQDAAARPDIALKSATAPARRADGRTRPATQRARYQPARDIARRERLPPPRAPSECACSFPGTHALRRWLRSVREYIVFPLGTGGNASNQST